MSSDKLHSAEASETSGGGGCTKRSAHEQIGSEKVSLIDSQVHISQTIQQIRRMDLLVSRFSRLGGVGVRFLALGKCWFSISRS